MDGEFGMCGPASAIARLDFVFLPTKSAIMDVQPILISIRLEGVHQDAIAPGTPIAPEKQIASALLTLLESTAFTELPSNAATNISATSIPTVVSKQAKGQLKLQWKKPPPGMPGQQSITLIYMEEITAFFIMDTTTG